jgi:hypothetical protein
MCCRRSRRCRSCCSVEYSAPTRGIYTTTTVGWGLPNQPPSSALPGRIPTPSLPRRIHYCPTHRRNMPNHGLANSGGWQAKEGYCGWQAYCARGFLPNHNPTSCRLRQRSEAVLTMARRHEDQTRRSTTKQPCPSGRVVAPAASVTEPPSPPVGQRVRVRN